MNDEQSNENMEDDIVLAELADDELVEQMHDDLYDGLGDEIVEGTKILLDRGWSAEKVLNDALVGGMRIVGIDFRDGILFVPEVLLAANAMKGGMAILRPLRPAPVARVRGASRRCNRRARCRGRVVGGRAGGCDGTFWFSTMRCDSAQAAGR